MSDRRAATLAGRRVPGLLVAIFRVLRAVLRFLWGAVKLVVRLAWELLKLYLWLLLRVVVPLALSSI